MDTTDRGNNLYIITADVDFQVARIKKMKCEERAGSRL